MPAAGPAAAAAPDPVEAQKGAMLAWMEAIAPYGIFTTDTALKIRSWNQWLASHSGLAPSAVLGRALTEVFPDVQTRHLDEHFQRALRGETSVLSTALHKYLLPLPTTIRGGHATQMLQTVRIAPLRLEQHVVGTIATIEDVTQRETQALNLRRQQEHDRLLSSALALLLASDNPTQVAAELFPRIAAPLKLEVYFNHVLGPDGVLRLGAAGGITPELRKAMAVLPAGEGPGGTAPLGRQPVHLAYVQDHTDPPTQAIRKMGLRVYAGFPLIVGERLVGTLAFGSYERDRLNQDEFEFLATIAQYIAIAIERAQRESALREAQQSLSRHAEELETKIAERTARLHETIGQLESFSYTVAHDLRAPIRSLRGYSEILLEDFGPEISEEGRTILRRLHRASNRLDALTRDLLSFSKIGRQDLELGPVDIDELVDEIVSVSPALQSSVLVHAPLGRVIAHRTLLQQCLSNLLDNALKFIDAGVMPRIVVRTELRPAGAIAGPLPEKAFNPPTLQRGPEGDSATPWPAGASFRRVWIEDNGIGIAPAAHEKIFGIFERVSGLDHVEGTGIGLAIVARATQQMGGACGVESALGAGSRFWIDLAEAPPRSGGADEPRA